MAPKRGVVIIFFIIILIRHRVRLNQFTQQFCLIIYRTTQQIGCPRIGQFQHSLDDVRDIQQFCT